MPRIARKSDLIENSAIRKITDLLAAARGKRNIYSLGGGAPSLPPPREIVDEAIRLMKEDSEASVRYESTRGIREFLNLISQDLKRHGGIDVDPERELLVTAGATGGILLSLMSIIDPGDEVILTDPTYLGYSEVVKLLGGRVVRLPVYVDEGFQPDPEELSKLITKRTKAFILLSPDNPSGRVVDEDKAKGIVDLAVDNDFWIICDDTYKDIVYEKKHVWISALPGAIGHTITVCSLSKSASIPGFRLGYMYGPSSVIDAAEKLDQYIILCPDTLGQLAMVKFYSNGVKERYLREVVIPSYKSRRDVMGDLIKEYMPRAKTVKPQGAFYYFLDASEYLQGLKMDDEKFAKDLLDKKGVVVIPGVHFGENGRRHLRLTFVSEPAERIEIGMQRIGEYLAETGVA